MDKMRETDKYYFFWKHEFGQWTLRDIVDEGGVLYNCCEQYMMANKALLFEDFEMSERIMNEMNPREQQLLGREVRNYDQGIWDLNKEEIVCSGNLLKFSQHDDLRLRLIRTYPKILAEASSDKIWGVGLFASDDRILDEKNWTGKSLLGKNLMRVRDYLMDE